MYVDDILVFAKEEKDIERTRKHLIGLHPMKDSGLVMQILGIRVKWKDDGSIELDQEKYVKQLLQEFGVVDSKSKPTPTCKTISAEDGKDQSLSTRDHKYFRRIVGRIMFLSTGTRPDVSFAVSRISQHLASSNQEHLYAAKHILRYLQGSAAYRLVYRRSTSESGEMFKAYVNSAYANSTNFKSTSGYVLTLNDSPVTWATKKQALTAQSTTEAEYVALADAGRPVAWIRHFLHSIRKSEVYCTRRGLKPTSIWSKK